MRALTHALSLPCAFVLSLSNGLSNGPKPKIPPQNPSIESHPCYVRRFTTGRGRAGKYLSCISAGDCGVALRANQIEGPLILSHIRATVPVQRTYTTQSTPTDALIPASNDCHNPRYIPAVLGQEAGQYGTPMTQRHRRFQLRNVRNCAFWSTFRRSPPGGQRAAARQAPPRAIAFGKGSGPPQPQFGGGFLSKDAISVKIPGLVDRFHGEFFDKVQYAIALSGPRFLTFVNSQRRIRAERHRWR